MLAQSKAVLFDFDGTLFHLDVPWKQIKQDIAQDYKNQFNQALPNSNQFYSMFNHIKLHHSSEIYQRYVNFLESQEYIAVQKKTSEPLWLTNHGLYQIADYIRFDTFYGIISSNFRKSIQTVLNQFGLGDRFKIILGRDDVEEMKPNPEGINQVLVSYDLEPHQVLYVGDLPSDEEAAKRANVPFLYVDRFQQLLLNTQ